MNIKRLMEIAAIVESDTAGLTGARANNGTMPGHAGPKVQLALDAEKKVS